MLQLEGMLKNIWVPFTSVSADSNPKSQKSVLAEWNSYSSSSAHDVEAGGAATAAPSAPSTSVLQNAEAAGSAVAGFFAETFKTVSSGVSTGVSTVASGEAFSIPSGQQLVYFFSFLAAGGVFLLLAFMVFLPVIILAPAKFALAFTLGCLSIMVGFMQLRGWKQQLQHMMSQERLPYSAAYTGSVLATLYAALIMKSYLLSLGCSGLQVVALLYYLMSYFPGGAQGVKFMLNLFYSAAMRCFGSVSSIVLK